ncbi:MAG: hypothetical protein AB1921_18190 [Thermodesulfobacteriota bacterium]
MASLCLAGILLAATVFECSALLVMTHPAVAGLLPGRLKGLVHDLYMARVVSVIQWLPPCSRYDPEITYTLRPGSCVFTNPEFETRVSVNSLGVRDSEASLAAPQVAVLGDSQAMGWGVGDGETFARVLEKETGLRVLDAAVSSYGTVREMMMLSRINRNDLEAVVLQYADNDLWENERFLENGKVLPVMDREEYDRTVEEGAHPPRYRFGDYLKMALLMAASRDRIRENTPFWPSVGECAGKFLDVLSSFSGLLAGRDLIVLELNETGTRTGFAPALRDALKNRGEIAPGCRVIVLDTETLLDPESDYYPLDGHLNRAGHQKLGRALARILKAREARVKVSP